MTQVIVFILAALLAIVVPLFGVGFLPWIGTTLVYFIGAKVLIVAIAALFIMVYGYRRGSY